MIAVTLGIDVSTTGLRVHVLDVDLGEQITVDSVSLPPVQGVGGRRVQHAGYGALALAAVARTVVGLGLGLGLGVKVAAVSVTTTSGTVVPVDADGAQIGPAVMYDDRSATSLETALTGYGDGRPLGMLARMARMYEDDDRIRFASVAQVIETALLGSPAPGDTSHFLKAGIDPTAARWPTELVARAGVPLSRLPDLVHPGTVLGTVSAGPASGAIVVAGMTDGCTSQLATGAVRPGDYVGVLGTTLVFKAVARDERLDASRGVYSHRAPDGMFWVGGASNVGGGSFRPRSGIGYDELSVLAEEIGPSPVVAYPLPRRGERFPLVAPDLDPVWIDLTGRPIEPPDDPATAYRAALEGVALVERLGVDVLFPEGPPGTVRASGGGTRSALGTRLRAAALEETVAIPRDVDSGYGAALIAAWRSSGDDLTPTIDRLTSIRSTVDPDVHLVEVMAERLATLRAVLADRGVVLRP